MCRLRQWEDDLPMDEDFDGTPGNDSGAVARRQHLFVTELQDLILRSRYIREHLPKLFDAKRRLGIAVDVVILLFLVTLIYAIFFK